MNFEGILFIILGLGGLYAGLFEKNPACRKNRKPLLVLGIAFTIGGIYFLISEDHLSIFLLVQMNRIQQLFPNIFHILNVRAL